MVLPYPYLDPQLQILGRSTTNTFFFSGDLSRVYVNRSRIRLTSQTSHISSKTSHIIKCLSYHHKPLKSSKTSHISSQTSHSSSQTSHIVKIISKSSQTSHILTFSRDSHILSSFHKLLSYCYEHLHTHQQCERAEVQSSEEQQKTTKGEKRILAPTFMVAWVEYGDRGSVVRFRSAIVRTSECDHASGIVHLSCERDVCSLLVG